MFVNNQAISLFLTAWGYDETRAFDSRHSVKYIAVSLQRIVWREAITSNVLHSSFQTSPISPISRILHSPALNASVIHCTSFRMLPKTPWVANELRLPQRIPQISSLAPVLRHTATHFLCKWVIVFPSNATSILCLLYTLLLCNTTCFGYLVALFRCVILYKIPRVLRWLPDSRNM
jgi:hypothetical protein